MKLFLSSCLLILCNLFTYAQNVDSLTYELQRKKVNTLLNERSQRFGQYTASLEKRTGIFGLQTKKDIRHSNEILMQIVTTDNHIFKELKILFDYRIAEQERVESLSEEAESRNMAYMNTINKLRNQLDELKKENQSNSSDNGIIHYLYWTVIMVLIAIIIFLYRRKTLKTTIMQ
jgi:hypothetical protein